MSSRDRSGASLHCRRSLVARKPGIGNTREEASGGNAGGLLTFPGLDDCIEPCYARFGLLMVQGRAALRSRRIGRGSRLYRLAQGRRSVPALGGRYPAHNGIRDAAANQPSPLRWRCCTLAYYITPPGGSKTPSRDGVLPFLGLTAPDQNSSSRYRAVSATTGSQQRAQASCCTHYTTRHRP